jgi:hypothetical protein
MCGSIEKTTRPSFRSRRDRKESIERGYLQIYQLLFDPTSVTRLDAVNVEDAVVAVKRWFHGQTEWSLVVFDCADALDDGGDESYFNLEFLLPDAPTVDIIITTRHVRAAEMTTLVAVEVVPFEVATYDDDLSFPISMKWARLCPHCHWLLPLAPFL